MSKDWLPAFDKTSSSRPRVLQVCSLFASASTVLQPSASHMIPTPTAVKRNEASPSPRVLDATASNLFVSRHPPLGVSLWHRFLSYLSTCRALVTPACIAPCNRRPTCETPIRISCRPIAKPAQTTALHGGREMS